MTNENDVLIERLKALKDKSGMSAAQISEKSGVPESTVTRILAGRTGNPTIITIMSMAKAMGGTAADIFDDDTQVKPATAVVVSDAEKYHNEVVALYKEMLKVRMRTIKILGGIVGLLMGILIFILLFDIFNSDIGFIRF